MPGGIIPELSIARESIKIPGSNANLIYQSTHSDAPATISIMFTSDSIPRTLAMVHLAVKVSGESFEKSFEADTNLSYVYEWSKRNVYNQKVYGIVQAEVSIGYEYTHCQHTIWNTVSVQLRGFDVDISNIGGWNLNIHHHYNAFQG